MMLLPRLEMESYMTTMGVTSILPLTEEPAVCSVTDTSATVDTLTRVVEQLSEHGQSCSRQCIVTVKHH